MLVNRAPALSAARLVAASDELRVVAPTWRPRGAAKLEGALDAFGIDPSGQTCLDVGASTGGFTMVLLERGARHVVCVDVGRGQLDESLRRDRRVDVFERTDIREFSWPLPQLATLAVVDVSFISVLSVLEHVSSLLAPGGDAVVLVKPQFEVGRALASRYRGVIPLGPERDEALQRVRDAMRSMGLATLGSCASTVAGAEGNVEEFVWVRTPSDPGGGG